VERSVGSSGPERSIQTAIRIDPNSVSRDGRWLGVTLNSDHRDIALLSLATGKVVPIPNPDRKDRANVSISPYGRWLAYTYGFASANAPVVANNAPEVHVRSFPKAAGGLTIPVDLNISGSAGGANPIWSSNGKEIVFLASDGKFKAVPVEGDANSLHPGAPRTLFQTRLRPDTARNFDITADGKCFLVNQPMELPIIVIVNWPQLLRK
jgi:hypothetical protein